MATTTMVVAPPPASCAWPTWAVAAATLWANSLMSGSVLGFTALKPLLVKSGLFRDACPYDDAASGGCSAQLLWIDWMFIVLASVMNILGFATGLMIDKIGTRNSFLLACCGVGIGSATFGLAIRDNNGPLAFASYCLMGVAGCNVLYVAMFKVNNALFGGNPRCRSLFNGLILTTWELSAALFLLAAVLHDDAGVSLPTFFYGYAALCAPVTLLLYLAIPANIDAVDAPDKMPESMSICARARLDYAAFRFDINFLTLWTSVFMLAHYFYLSTAYEQLLWLQGGDPHGDDSAAAASARQYAFYFSVIFSAFGAVYALFAGVLLESLGTSKSALFITVLQAVCGIASVIPLLPLQFVTFFTLVAARSGMWLLFYRFLQKRVTRTYATFAGVICSVAGLVNTAGFGLTYFAQVTAGFNFLYCNLFLLVLCVACGALQTAWYRDDDVHPPPMTQHPPRAMPSALQQTLALFAAPPSPSPSVVLQ